MKDLTRENERVGSWNSGGELVHGIVEETGYPVKKVNGSQIIKEIPKGVKENVYYIVSEDDNILRSSSGMKNLYPDDCGTWVNGRRLNNIMFWMITLSNWPGSRMGDIAPRKRYTAE